MDALETERLLLKPLELSDAPQIQQLFPHWEIVRYLANSVTWPSPPDGAERYCRESALPAMDRGDEWHWTLRLRTQPDRVIGMIGLLKGTAINRGFRIGSQWQRKGLMSEAVDRVTRYWFQVLGFPVLRAPKAIANHASRRISEKSGMRLVAVEESEYVSGRLPSQVWEITAEEWRKRERSDL
jgi:RimJ/RimL family protein N-acetyltransferase